MKKIIVLIIDVLIVLASIWLSFQVLNYFNQLSNYAQNIDAFYNLIPYIISIYLVVAYVFGMLNLQTKSITENLYTIFLVTIGLTTSIMAMIYLSREEAEAYPRSVIFLSPVIYYIGLMVWRITVQKLYIKSHGQRRIIIIGEKNEKINDVLNKKFKNFYSITNEYPQWEDNILKTFPEIDDIIITDSVSFDERNRIILLNNDYPLVNIYIVPRISDISLINSRLVPFGDIAMQSVGKLYLKPEELIVKRFMDITISILLLIICLPFMAIIALIIKLDGGPVLFIQERLTRGGKTFQILKFRSMTTDAEKNTGPILAEQGDKRITPIGKILRATRLDELPQLWNILIGDMSLVGPRPERPVFAKEIEEGIPEFKYRLNVKAGLTGFAQIMGKYNTDFKQKLNYDLHYINNFSIFKDILILLQTIKVIFWKEHTEGVKSNTSQQLKNINH